MYARQSTHLNKCLPKSFKVPTEQDVKKAVEEVLLELRGQAPVQNSKPATITKIGKERKNRPVKSTLNTFRSDFKEIHQYSNMLPHVEDVFMGAIRQNTTGNVLNKHMVFNLLKSLDLISSEAIYVIVNSHRPVEEHISERYARQLASACRNVISAFEHHLDRKNIRNYVVEDSVDIYFDSDKDSENYSAHVQTEQIYEQKRQLLIKAGFTDIQIYQFMSGEKVDWHKSISCKGGSSVCITSNHGHIDTYPKSYDDIEWLADICCYVDKETDELFTYS